MNRRTFLCKTTSAVIGVPALCCKSTSTTSEKTRPPNIILILADDMGFSDAGCCGGEIDTPNIDRLAANGLRFSQFYNAARCCPTRASLMTGLYPHQVNLARNGRTLGRNGLTIAEGLKGAGYQTAMVGKWHLSETRPLEDPDQQLRWLNHRYDPGRPFAPVDSYPVNRGFDHHYGVIWGVVDYYDPFSLVEGTVAVDEVSDDYYFTDAITERAVETIVDFGRQDVPFFLYVAHTAPHWPLHAPPEEIRKYAETYKNGWNTLRRNRFKRQLELGMFGRETTVLPSVQDGGKSWEELSQEEKRFMGDKMAVHAAMVDRMDQGVGRIAEALQKTGQLENTLLLFLSDNGASPEQPSEMGPGFDRPSETRDGRKISYRGFYEPGSETTFCGIETAWANATNTPFRYWKKESFEGGCHTPLIAHWPAGLRTRPGSWTDQVGHVMDVLPTCLELAGVEYPAQYGGYELTPLEGKSLAPIFRGETRVGHQELVFEHERGRAIRKGDWKLVSLEDRPWELYDLRRDRTETKNLAAEHPDRVEQMSHRWERWAHRVGLL